MGPGDWVSGGAAIGMFLLSAGAVFISHGRSANRLENAEGDIKALVDRVAKLEELSATVAGLAKSVAHMGELMKASNDLAHSEMLRLSESMIAGHKLMETHLAGFREMTDREMRDIKENVRAIRTSLDDQRIWTPAAPERRRAKPAPA